MIYTGITPIHNMGGIFVKREDIAYWESLEYPSGSKVRQYFAMAEPHLPHNQSGAFEQGFHPRPMVPCIVGCSANSAQQIYVAATAKQLNTKGIIYTAKRKVKSEATKYAESLGAEINYVPYGYLSVIRKAFRQRVADLNRQVVAWDRDLAIQDAYEQCKNLPEGINRIIVPTGSGLTAAGVLAGLPDRYKGKPPRVIAVATSPMASREGIIKLAEWIRKDKTRERLGELELMAPTVPYDTPQLGRLPDDTPLDPFYAAKAWPYVQQGDLLWTPGLRPVISMPEVCQKEFQDWKGPQ